MQKVNCVVAVGGDIGNKIQKLDITVAEVALLRVVHGEGAVTEVYSVGESDESDRQVYEALKNAYPKYAFVAERLWMDGGGRLPGKIGELGLTREMLSRDYEAKEAAAEAPPPPPRAARAAKLAPAPESESV